MEIPKIRAVSDWMEGGVDRTSDRCPWDEDILKTFRSLFQALSDIKLPYLLLFFHLPCLALDLR